VLKHLQIHEVCQLSSDERPITAAVTAVTILQGLDSAVVFKCKYAENLFLGTQFLLQELLTLTLSQCNTHTLAYCSNQSKQCHYCLATP